MVITSTGAVGIGSASPAYIIDAVGIVRGTTGLIAGNGTGVVALNLLDAAAAAWQITTGSNNLSINNNSASWTNRMTITQAGSVGIGSAVPAYALDVVGTARGTTGLVAGNGTGVVSLNLLDGASAAWQITTGSNNLSINNNSASWTNRLTITSVGAVGIGSATPAYALDVVGTARGTTGLIAGNGTGVVALNLLDVAAASWQITTGSNNLSINNNSASWTNRITINSAGRLGVGTATPGYAVDVVGSLNVSGSLLVNGVPFSAGSTTWLTSGANLYFNTGSVGIGTSGPSTKLHIYSPSSNSIVLEQSGTGANYMSFISNGTTYGNFGLEKSDGTGIFGNNTAYGMSIGTPVATNFNIATNSLVRMTVLSGGNVGIGSTSPSGLLDVYGANPTLRIKTSTAPYSSGYATLLFDTITASYPLAQITATDMGVSPGVYQGILQFWTQYNATLVERMRISSTGNVGIGTQSPSNPLHIASTAASRIQLQQTGTDPNYMTFTSNGTVYGYFGLENSVGGGLFGSNTAYGMSIGAPTATNFNISTSNIVRMTVKSDGTVGIGTTIPGTLLTCYQAISGATSGWAGRGYFGGDTVGAVLGQYNDIVQMGGHNKALTTWAKICINPDGNYPVGIGTYNPTAATLHVQGTIYASGDITALSDQRYKQNLIPLSNCLDSVCSLTGYSYTRTDYKPGESQIGLIAQEVKQVFPQAVNYDTESDIYSLNYTALIAPLVQSIKELREEVKQLKARLG
jgi:hypothetical protein